MSSETRERLEVLIGEWTLEAGPPGGPPWPGGGRVSFEWMEGAPLLVQRWSIDLPEAPDGVAVIGCDGSGGGYRQLYTDERDVQRIYEMSLADGVWRLWRDGEPFAQRFTGRIADDGNAIAGRWERTDDAGEWVTDFDLTYTRVGDRTSRTPPRP
jgi:hypothetical protein